MSVPSFLLRLSYLLSIILGSSAVIAGTWSTFLLPLLHSSFSARRALVDQQTPRLTTLVEKLRALRKVAVYSGTSGGAGKETLEQKIEEPDGPIEEKGRLIETLFPAGSPDLSPARPPQPFFPNVLPLTSPLRDLSSAVRSTSTTRISLLSTLESYTSQLHREIYLRSGPSSKGHSVGLGTLGQNLAKEAGVESGLSAQCAGVKGEEWDAVRKEIRAIKGLLLNRRSFMDN